MTPEEMVAKRKAEVVARRLKEAACAYDFLTRGDDEAGAHAERCVLSPPCSREYDPRPYPEAVPHDRRLYENTGIAALYGLPGGEAYAWQLAGWNVRKEIK